MCAIPRISAGKASYMTHHGQINAPSLSHGQNCFGSIRTDMTKSLRGIGLGKVHTRKTVTNRV